MTSHKDIYRVAISEIRKQIFYTLKRRKYI